MSPVPAEVASKFRFCHGKHEPDSPFSELTPGIGSAGEGSGHPTPDCSSIISIARRRRMEESSERSTGTFRSPCIFHRPKPAISTQIKLKEGTNHGYKATEYPDSLGR